MKSKFLKFWFLFLLVTITGCGGKKIYSDVEKENFVVKFGVFNEDSYTLKEETTTIPLKYQDTGFSVGYVIYAKDKSYFKEYSIAYPPKKGILGRDVKATGVNNGLKGPVASSINGSVGHKFGFDKGDPSGKWLLDIYVNDNLIKEIEFDVVEQK